MDIHIVDAMFVMLDSLDGHILYDGSEGLLTCLRLLWQWYFLLLIMRYDGYMLDGSYMHFYVVGLY